MSFEGVVRSCLYNWLGYGNINASVWFVGMEEGGAEIWRHSSRTLEQSLLLRSTYDLSMDFRYVWENKYGIPLNTFRGITVWHYMAAFLLSLRGINANSARIRDFLFSSKELGGQQSDHFLCELLPLPRRSNTSIEGYESIWESVDAYKTEIMSKRFKLITDTLKENTGVKLLVSYDKAFTTQALKYYPLHKKAEWQDSRGKRYCLYSLSLNDTKEIHLLSTPFFGQGQCSYEGLADASRRVSSLLH